jgi:hypothetical protein
MSSVKKKNASKKVWATPALEVIEVKTKTGSKFFQGINHLDPHGC